MDLIDLVNKEDKNQKKEKDPNSELNKKEKDYKYNYYIYENKKLNKWNDLIKYLDQMIQEESIYRNYLKNI
jgi:hypothetical protein